MEKYCKSCGRVFKDSNFKICPYCGNQLSARLGRQPIPRKLRHQVFQRDGYRCRECGATNKETRLHVDHITPVAKGGTNDLSNLQTLCEECNRAKYTDEWVGGELKGSNYDSNSRSYFHEKGMKALKEDKKNRDLWDCPKCNHKFAKVAKICPYCGLDLTDTHSIESLIYKKQKRMLLDIEIKRRKMADYGKKRLLKDKDRPIWKFCPYCNHRLNKVAKKCPYCNYNFNKTYDNNNQYNRTSNLTRFVDKFSRFFNK